VPGPGKALASITAAHSICLPRAMARVLLPGSTSTPSLASLTRRYTPMALYLMGHKYVLWGRFGMRTSRSRDIALGGALKTSRLLTPSLPLLHSAGAAWVAPSSGEKPCPWRTIVGDKPLLA
jgi:hypothetical protein